jgi:hypothetical protein
MDDPLGYSHRQDYGAFHNAITFEAITTSWSSLDDFATDVIAAARKLGAW